MNTVMADLIEHELERPEIQAVMVSEDSPTVDLKDGRTIITPCSGIRVYGMQRNKSNRIFK